MLKLRRDQTPLNGEDYKRFGELVNEVLEVRDAIALRRWLDNSLKPFIPHDLMMVAWGDFHLGVIHSDVFVGPSSQDLPPQLNTSLTPLLVGLFDRWTANGRKPFALNVSATEPATPAWGTTAQPVEWLADQKSCMVHGVSDQRGKHDYLYVFFSAHPKRRRDETNAIKVLLPYLDVAFRQVSPPEPAKPDAAKVAVDIPLEPDILDTTQLGPRELQIMQLVMVGSSNEDISSTLDISSFTLKNHMQKIFMKLDVFNRAQAITTFKNLYPTAAAEKAVK